MDVRWHAYRLVALLMGAIGIIGCDRSQSTVQHHTFKSTPETCRQTSHESQFIVKWQEGSYSTIMAKNREAFIAEFLKPYEAWVEYAEHDQIVSLQKSPQRLKGYFRESTNWGQQVVNAKLVWQQGYYGQTSNGRSIVVALVDSGVDPSHKELTGQFLVNNFEKPNNQIDDDGNGLIDDYVGYDFAQNRGTLSDPNGHGTHIAGIIVGKHDKGEVLGVAPEAKVLPLSFMDQRGQGEISAAIEAIQYAADRGAQVINASWGGPHCSQALADVIKDLEARDILFVAAAGNSGRDIDVNPEYPAAFDSANLVTVGASTHRGYMAGFSNMGFLRVHLVAPGVDIFSTQPNQRSAARDGTSMAAPFVSAAAALLWSAYDSAPMQEVRQALLQSVDLGPFPVHSRGRLNIERALEYLKSKRQTWASQK